MIGDKLVIKAEHTERANDIFLFVKDKFKQPYVISIAGESGSGKSETAYEIHRILFQHSINAAILQQDDYFVFPPKTNRLMRMNNEDQVGLYEVKLDFLDSNIRSFKRRESPIYKPLVDFDKDLVTHEEMDLSNVEILIVEGTYTSILEFTDLKIFLEGDFNDTLNNRKERNREKSDRFIEEILQIEHRIISEHSQLADIRISSDFKKMVIEAEDN